MQLLQGSNCAGHDGKFTEVVKSQSRVLTMLWRKYQPILKLILIQIRLCKRKCAKKACNHVFKLYFHLIHLLLNVWPCQAKNNRHERSFLWPSCFFILQWQFCKKWTSRKQWFSGRNQFSGTCLNAPEPVRLPVASWFVQKWNTVLK